MCHEQGTLCERVCHGLSCQHVVRATLRMLSVAAGCTDLISHLSVSLQEQNSQEESHKRQKAKQLDVILPPLCLLAVPAN